MEVVELRVKIGGCAQAVRRRFTCDSVPNASRFAEAASGAIVEICLNVGRDSFSP
jgi:hypothetical protein